MFDKEEKELRKLSIHLKEIPKPDNIEQYIKKGISLGVKKKRNNKIKLFANIAAILILSTFIASVRTIPAFANYVSRFPGLEHVVNLINHDKGLKSAIENEFIQKVNASVTHDDLTFTIKDLIIDESRAIIFYSIESKGNHRFVNLDMIEFRDENGERLVAGITWSAFNSKDLSVEREIEGKVELNFTDGSSIPNTIFINVTLKESQDDPRKQGNEEHILDYIWKFEIPVDHEKIKNAKVIYELNETIVIEEQKITFKEAIITPTRIAVHVKYDQYNTKKILRFEDIKLVNGKGETWGRLSNGIVGSIISEYEEILYFQSNYFLNPDELYITGMIIRALDKEKAMVKIDLQEKKFVNAPDERLSLVDLEKKDATLTLKFKFKNPETTNHYNIFSYLMKDSLGNEYHKTSAGTQGGEDYQYIQVTFKGTENITGPVYLKIEDYPKRIKGEFKVRIR